jgi:hypothetical protein
VIDMGEKYPESVLTKNRKGELEIRNLISRGRFVIYNYRDPKTFKRMENNKRKIYLKDEAGKVEEYYIIPTQTPNRALFITPKKAEEKVRSVWNNKKKSEESLW